MPERHVGELEHLTVEEAPELWQGVTSAVRALKQAYAPDGLNIGVNLGRAAGAGCPATSMSTSCRGGTATRTS